MNGIIIVYVGIGVIVLSVVLFIVSMVYRNTTGKKIREELDVEY